MRSKRLKKLLEEEQRKEKLYREWFGEPPKPAPEPIPPGQIEDLKAGEKMLSDIVHGHGVGIDDVLNFTRKYSHYFENMSSRMNYVNKHIPHYQKLKSAAAKKRLWDQIQDRLYGLQTELFLLRQSKERGGMRHQ